MHFNTKEHFFLSFVAIIFLIAFSNLDAKTVIIDPGHGGKDKGAYWYGISEKTLTLDVAKKVELLLKQKGIKVLMTRKSDRYVSIEDRASIANKYTNSIFVSIHFNAHTNSP